MKLHVRMLSETNLTNTQKTVQGNTAELTKRESTDGGRLRYLGTESVAQTVI